MAYRSIYESAYGFETLDTLHNFFPELLYDDELFPNDMLRFMRMRMNTLFSPTYAREMHSYQIYAAAERRSAMNQWMNLRPVVTTVHLAPEVPPQQAIRETPAPAVAVPSPVSPARAGPPATVAPPPVPEPAPATPATPHPPTRVAAPTYAQAARRVIEPNPLLTPISVRSSAVTTPEAPRRALTARTRILGAAGALQVNPMEELLNSLINPVPNLNSTNIYTNNGVPNISLFDILGGTGLNFADVPVVPTNDEVESGSEIVEHIDVPVETKCSICQDHEPAAPTTWRKLHCSHYFHKTCIDPWFERDVHCPVCRADIRDAGEETEEDVPPPPRAAMRGAGSTSEN